MIGADKTLTIRSRTASVNAEGQVTYSNSDTSVRGRITQITVSDRNDLTKGPDGMRSHLPEAIAWVPLNATISDADQIVVSGYNTLLNGTWEIQAIQHTPNHYRCHLIGVLT